MFLLLVLLLLLLLWPLLLLLLLLLFAVTNLAADGVCSVAHYASIGPYEPIKDTADCDVLLLLLLLKPSSWIWI